MSCNVCSIDLQPHESLDCLITKKGGISGILILLCDHGITDFSNFTQVNNAILAGNAFLVDRIKGNMPAGSPIEGTSPLACGAQTILDNIDWTLTWLDYYDTPTNHTHYDSLNTADAVGMLVYLCEDDEMLVIEDDVTFVATYLVPESNAEKRGFSTTAKWRSLTLPVLNLTPPPGIFS